MRKAAIRDGDPTTTGGLVIARSSTISDDGRKVALSDDGATCGNCKGVHKIHGTGKGIKEKGRCVVVDGDIILCPCKQNRVLIGRNPGKFLESGGDSGNARSTGAASLASSSSVASVFDQQVVLRLPSTGKLLAGVRYRARSASGRIFEGTTDSMGRTERIITAAAERLEFEIAGY
ncbi:PAAR domain-containing protein [Caballeronia glebae]|uniref:PAAR domain-containing protein n=1 Tax=Caballeronia glebae TaxID=1777143 RepID=UPI0038B9AE24